MSHRRVWILGVAMGVTAMSCPCSAQTNVDPANAVWHIGLDALWGPGGRNDIGKRLDIYPVFQDGKWVNALVTARGFNTSIHFVEETGVAFDPASGKVQGTMDVLITPDLWVPADRQPFTIRVNVDGTMKREGGASALEGTYAAERPDGQPISGGTAKVQGKLVGKADPMQTGWEDSVWRACMSQVAPPGGLDLDAIDVELGVADAKVRWGRIGVSAQAKWPATKTYPFDVSKFEPVSAAGVVRGSTEVTGRHLHPGGDPETKYRMDLVFRRVQGLAGGTATLTRLENGKPSAEARRAYGRGGAAKGGGKSAPEALWVHDLDTRPWWLPVEGHKPVAAGEHPRLLFRKSDLASIRRRAETPEGKGIVARLRLLLGNDGEALPTQFSDVPPANHRQSKPMPLGAFTTWHAAGFGFLYQLTGDKKYAELARGCVQFMLDGKVDIDNRYAWFKPGTDLRAGSVLAAMAYAYDFCYDAWPDDFRKKIALEIQDFNKETCSPKEPASIARLAGRSGYPPGSNHYGSLIGGTGVALLAIRGDPGTDTDWVNQRLAEVESNISRMLELGFGDGGWFAEGFGSSSSLSRLPTMELIHAERTANGRDYLHPRPNAQGMMLTWILHLGGYGKQCMPNRGVYEGDENIGRGGEIAVGFGALEPKYRPALLWTYKTFVEENPQQPVWDTHAYPHHAVYALLNWVFGSEAKNPAEVLPRTAVDHVHGYVVARNRWQDADDIIVTHWLGYGPPGYYTSRDFKGRHQRVGMIRVWGYGLRTGLSTGQSECFATHYEAQTDGSFTLTAGGTGLAVDFSGKSGAEAVVIAVGPKACGPGKDETAKNEKASTQVAQLKLGDAPVNVLTLQTGKPPAVTVDGNAVRVGAQRFTWDGRVLTADRER